MCQSLRILRRCGRCNSLELVNSVVTACDRGPKDEPSPTSAVACCPSGIVETSDQIIDGDSPRVACRSCRVAQNTEGVEVLQSSSDMLTVHMRARLVVDGKEEVATK